MYKINILRKIYQLFSLILKCFNSFFSLWWVFKLKYCLSFIISLWCWTVSRLKASPYPTRRKSRERAQRHSKTLLPEWTNCHRGIACFSRNLILRRGLCCMQDVRDLIRKFVKDGFTHGRSSPRHYSLPVEAIAEVQQCDDAFLRSPNFTVRKILRSVPHTYSYRFHLIRCCKQMLTRYFSILLINFSFDMTFITAFL